MLLKTNIQKSSRKDKERCSASLISRNANQNKLDTTLHYSEWPSLKSLQIINAGEQWRKENPPILLVGI